MGFSKVREGREKKKMSKDDEKEKRCVLKVINILSFEDIIPFSFLPHACITVLKKRTDCREELQ